MSNLVIHNSEPSRSLFQTTQRTPSPPCLPLLSLHILLLSSCPHPLTNTLVTCQGQRFLFCFHWLLLSTVTFCRRFFEVNNGLRRSLYVDDKKELTTQF